MRDFIELALVALLLTMPSDTHRVEPQAYNVIQPDYRDSLDVLQHDFRNIKDSARMLCAEQ